MAEVLAKAEKYINGEEALISKESSSSNHKEKAGLINGRDEAQKDNDLRRGPQRKIVNGPRRDAEALETA